MDFGWAEAGTQSEHKLESKNGLDCGLRRNDDVKSFQAFSRITLKHWRALWRILLPDAA